MPRIDFFEKISIEILKFEAAAVLKPLLYSLKL